MDKYAAVWKEAGWGNIFWGIEGYFLYRLRNRFLRRNGTSFLLQWDKSLTLKTNGRAISKDYESVETVDWAKRQGVLLRFDQLRASDV